MIEPLSLPSGLYIVATPLGHARDITLRALDVLSAADVILCEDTRTTGKLTARYGIATQRLAYHEHNAEAMRPKILAKLEAGASLALVSDAGTPLISDPGMPLVKAVRAAGHAVYTVPGASAPIAALSIAGLPTDRFSFAGFLPQKAAARARALQDLAQVPGTLVVFESAKRLADLLTAIDEILGPREVSVARELTKKFEQVVTGTAADLAAQFTAQPPRGEIVVLIAQGVAEAPSADNVAAMLRDALTTMSRRDAVQSVADVTGLPRKQVYAQALSLDASLDTPRDAPPQDATDKNKKNHNDPQDTAD